MARLRQLYVQVLIAIAFGIALGLWAPTTAVEVKPLGDAFIALLRMLLGPIIFCSVVLGLTHVRDVRQSGRLAFKARLYFEIPTTMGMAGADACPAAGAVMSRATPATLKAAGE